MTNLEMFYFVGKCITIDEHPEFRDVIVQKIEEDEIEWAHFVSLCSNHLILPVIYLKFKAHKLIEYLPEELAEFLNEIYNLNLSRNERILLQVRDLLKLLNANEIYLTFLKGTGNLLDGIYSDKGERMIGDIDFLVPEKDYLKAAKILEDNGYEITNPYYGNALRDKHYPPIIKDGVPAYVEIHRLIVHRKHIKYLNPLSIKKKELNNPEQSGNFVLCDKDKVIHNFIHSQFANLGNFKGIMSLRDIYDLYLMSGRTDLTSIVSSSPHKGKCISYFVFAGAALGLPRRFYPFETFKSKVLLIKHSLNYNSTVFNKTFLGILFIYERLFCAYLGQLFEAFYSKKMRRAVFERLSKRQWYVNQLNGYINFFKH